MADLPREPITRQEEYLSRLAGEDTTLPREPVTREEMYLEGAIARVEAVEEEVEELKNNPDVVDVVATYADLQAYDTSTLTDKDVIRVLTDSTHDDESTYYRYNKQSDLFTYIGTSKTYSNFVGTDGTAAGAAGLVPAPATTDAGKVLGASGNWVDGGPTVVQTTGNSTTNVMSQKATTEMVYDSWGSGIDIGAQSNWDDNVGFIALGKDTYLMDNYGEIAIGNFSVASGWNGSIALGYRAKDEHGGVALGAYSEGDSILAIDGDYGAVSVGCGGPQTFVNEFGETVTIPAFTRRIINVKDPHANTDAATKGYVDTAVAGAGPTVVQATGTSTTNVMSQNATTGMVYADPATKKRIQIGNNTIAGNSANYNSVAIGDGAKAYTGNDVVIGNSAQTSKSGASSSGGGNVAIGKSAAVGTNNTLPKGSIAIGDTAVAGTNYSTAVGTHAEALGVGSIALGSYATTTSSQRGIMNIGTTSTNYGYSMSNYRLLTGLYDPQSAHDAATKGYIDGRIIQNAGAPTTSTVGTVGQLLEDTTNGKLYICTDATNPYVWEEVGGSSVQYYSNAELETLWEGN